MRNTVSNSGGVAYDQIFRAIGDPHRLQILTLLREKELSAGEILQALDVVQSTLSHHMKSLVDTGVVNASRHGKWIYYSLNTETLNGVIRYLGVFAEGTRMSAVFPGKEEEGGVKLSAGMPDRRIASQSEPEPAADSDTASEKKSSSQKPDREAARDEREGKKPSSQKPAREAFPDEREGKKKSKKGKKGKKNKK